MSSDMTEQIIITAPLSEGDIPLRSIEIIQFLNEDGKEGVAVRWQGTGNIVAELGMLEYAKQVLIEERFYTAVSTEDDPDSEDEAPDGGND